MKATGIVRRIDDLGRIVIPREIRKTLNIREGDPLEIYTDPNERAVCFKPYLPYFEPWRLLEDAAETMRDSKDFHEFATDVYALASKIKKSARG
jgi:AbrB family transcriptional regulator (stage V sporulation protein T)